jgi:Tol biopolymer transport system component/DNA-binding winged helix-turn-helix (wHTH) protein
MALPHIHMGPARPVRFGVFEADLDAGELRKEGVPVRLQDQPFQLLAMLLNRPGEVVTREDLREKLWPGNTFVDFDRSVNTAVSKVRDALGDSAESPRFIQTLPRRGYRFICPLLQTQQREPMAVAPSTAMARQRVRWPYYAVGWALVIGAIAAVRLLVSAREYSAQPLHARVLTSFVGVQGQPSLSPNGDQFAFAWDGDVPNGPLHVYISLIGKGTPLRLTPENEEGWGPSWSPDGQSIAFRRFRTGTQVAKSRLNSGLRLSQESELLVIPALGGPSHRIASGTMSEVASWSPDAKWLLWSQRAPDSYRQFILAAPAGGGGARKLLDPPPNGEGNTGDFDPAVSPDGHGLVWSRCVDDFDCDLYLAGFQEGRLTGTLRQLTHDHKQKRNPHWSNDGEEIVYIGGEAYSELLMYRVPAAGGQPHRIEGLANANYLNLVAKSNRLIYSTRSVNFDIRRLDLNAVAAKPERFLASTRYEVSPSYSPDGKRIAFSSNRSGVRQIWVADSSGDNLSPLTSFSDGVASSPKWSPDGQVIVFDARPGSNADIYTVPAGGGAVKRLTDNPGQDHVPTWSPDGKWIYFGSARAGGHEIFRMRPDGSAVQQMTHDGGFYGMVAPDGKWLYYSVPLKGLWKMPADGGQTTQVLSPASSFGIASFVVTTRGIYALGAQRQEGFPFVIYPFGESEPRTLISLSRFPVMFPEVSPDGRWLLYTTADDAISEILLAENFR